MSTDIFVFIICWFPLLPSFPTWEGFGKQGVCIRACLHFTAALNCDVYWRQQVNKNRFINSGSNPRSTPESKIRELTAPVIMINQQRTTDIALLLWSVFQHQSNPEVITAIRRLLSNVAFPTQAVRKRSSYWITVTFDREF
jgi:hypothetical protein